VLVAFGGGGPMHAAAMMRDLHCKKVVVPAYPGVFSAFGMLMTDLRADFIRTTIARTDQLDLDFINRTYAEMEQQGLQQMAAEHVAESDVQIQRYADMRYKGQEHTVKVPVPNGPITAGTIEHVNEAFHALHEHNYTFRLDTVIELVNYHVTAIGLVSKAQIGKVSGQGTSLSRARKATRPVVFEDFDTLNTPIYERDLLPLNRVIQGPAVIEEPASSTVVYPDQQVQRDSYGFLHIEPVKQSGRFGASIRRR
jgi:N-methylhydantoinase A